MNVEYLALNGNTGPIIRLFPAIPETTAQLIAAIRNLTPPSVVWVHQIAGFSSVAGCELALGVQSKDIGVIINGSVPNFLWALSKQTWSDVAELLQPFTESSYSRNGFQWLYGPNATMGRNGAISVLITESMS